MDDQRSLFVLPTAGNYSARSSMFSLFQLARKFADLLSRLPRLNQSRSPMPFSPIIANQSRALGLG
jgi:hypothetical protein